jgi:hypothetical protein
MLVYIRRIVMRYVERYLDEIKYVEAYQFV